MTADHVQANDLEESSGAISPTAEFTLLMVITGVIAAGGVAFLTF